MPTPRRYEPRARDRVVTPRGTFVVTAVSKLGNGRTRVVLCGFKTRLTMTGLAPVADWKPWRALLEAGRFVAKE